MNCILWCDHKKNHNHQSYLFDLSMMMQPQGSFINNVIQLFTHFEPHIKGPRIGNFRSVVPSLIPVGPLPKMWKWSSTPECLTTATVSLWKWRRPASLMEDLWLPVCAFTWRGAGCWLLIFRKAPISSVPGHGWGFTEMYGLLLLATVVIQVEDPLLPQSWREQILDLAREEVIVNAPKDFTPLQKLG